MVENVCRVGSVKRFLLANSGNNDITLCLFQCIIVVYI